MDKRRKFQQRVQIVISLFALLIGITLTTLAYAPKANACDPRCFSNLCGSGSCDVQAIFCSSNCSGDMECLQEVGFCYDNNMPCMCGICTFPGYCD